MQFRRFRDSRQGPVDFSQDWRTGVNPRTLITSELHRSRRFHLPLTVALFTNIVASQHQSVIDIATIIQGEMREFDYVAASARSRSIAVWMVGTPDEGARIKVNRLKANPHLGDILMEAPVGLATFPTDGMTYEALLDMAQSSAQKTAACAELTNWDVQGVDIVVEMGAVRVEG